MSQPKFLKYNADIDFKDSAIKRETLQIIIGIDLVASVGRPDANTKKTTTCRKLPLQSGLFFQHSPAIEFSHLAYLTLQGFGTLAGLVGLVAVQSIIYLC